MIDVIGSLKIIRKMYTLASYALASHCNVNLDGYIHICSAVKDEIINILKWNKTVLYINLHVNISYLNTQGVTVKDIKTFFLHVRYLT